MKARKEDWLKAQIKSKEAVEPHPGDTATVYAYKLKLNWFMTEIDASKIQYKDVFGMDMYRADIPPVTAITPAAVIMTE